MVHTKENPTRTCIRTFCRRRSRNSGLSALIAILMVTLPSTTASPVTKNSDGTATLRRQGNTEDTGLAAALIRLDAALESLSSFFHENRDAFIRVSESDDEKDISDLKGDQEPIAEEIDEEKKTIMEAGRPESMAESERELALTSGEGGRPEFTAGFDDRDVDDSPTEATGALDMKSSEKEEALLKAALRYLMKLQRQDRTKKDYDIPFPMFGYKRRVETEDI